MSGVSTAAVTHDGVRFRSRLEQSWAAFLDLHEVVWQYEPERLVLEGQVYVPDFELVEVSTILEVKGLCDNREYKALMFGKLLARDHGLLTVLGRSPAGTAFQIVHPTPQETAHALAGKVRLSHEVFFAQCAECRRWQFIEASLAWDCRACGFYAGASTYLDFIYPTHRP